MLIVEKICVAAKTHSRVVIHRNSFQSNLLSVYILRYKRDLLIKRNIFRLFPTFGVKWVKRSIEEVLIRNGKTSIVHYRTLSFVGLR
jgi:hypothetical protein